MGVSWKKLVKTRLVAYLLCCKVKQEVKHLVLYSRKCKIKSLPCTVFNEPSVTTELVKLGSGGLCGCQSNQISNVPSLLNTKQNTKKRLPLLRPISARLLLNTIDLPQLRTNMFLLSKAVDQLFKKSLTKPT